MRVTHFNHLRLAQAFVDYMATCGITLRIEHHDTYFILLDDPSKTSLVANELERFVGDPMHPRYQEASWQLGNTACLLDYPRKSFLSLIFQGAGSFSLSVMAACISLFILIQIVGLQPLMQWLSWPANQDQYLQLWRWFSHALLHFSLLHIMFNLWWWWHLGGVIEKRLGSSKLLIITLISALLSGWVQSKFSGISFGGLSGVVYALMGYAWLRGKFDPASGIHVEHGLMTFAVLWLVIGYFDVLGLSVANAAHMTGLIVGLAMAWVDRFQNSQ